MNSSREPIQTALPPVVSLEEFIRRTSGQNRFLVLDCHEGNFFEPGLDHFQVEESKRFRMPVHTVEGGEKDPLLVHLDNEFADMLMEAALEEIVEDCLHTVLGPRNIAAFISSVKGPEHLVRNFVQAARVRLEIRDKKSTAFRFFDPRVMHTLQRLFNPPQMAMLLGPVTYWGYVDFRGQFRLVENISPRRSLSSVVIRKEQAIVLRRNATVQKALQQLKRYRADWPENLDAVLDGHVERAPQDLRELTRVEGREENLATYAALCWLRDTGRIEGQLIEQALAEHRKSSASLVAVIENLSPELF